MTILFQCLKIGKKRFAMSCSNDDLPKRRRSLRETKPTVKFGVEDDEDNNEGLKIKRKSQKMSVIYGSDDSSINIDDNNLDLSDIQTENRKPIELYTDKEDVNGASIYQFPTPSKRGAMAQKAALNRQSDIKNEEKRSLRRRGNVVVESAQMKPRQNRSIATGSRHTDLAFEESEGESESVDEDEDAYVPSENEKLDMEDSSSDDAQVTIEDESSDDYSENDNDKVEEENRTGKCSSEMKNISSLKPRRSARINYQDYHLKTDEYFEMQSSRALTSNRTLGRLANPRLDEEKLQLLLTKQNHVTKEHKKAMRMLSENYRDSYPMWYYAMEEGYNLLLYGLGSKRMLIDDFRKEILADHPTLVVNGFFPGLTIKEILNGIIVNLLEVEYPPNPNQCLNLIEQILKDNPDDRLYLIVHNIDGLMLRSSKAQDTLSQLASIPNLSLIGSIDHINAPLIWDSVKHSRYNFCWWDVTTFLPYDVETSFQSSVMVKRNETLAFSSLVNVFLSLTTKARAIYIILVKDQIEHGNDKTYPGMAFKDLYRNAREAFLGNSDVTLRTHLKEFLDHKLVRSKRNVDGAEYLNIPLDNSLLKQFIEQHGNAE